MNMMDQKVTKLKLSAKLSLKVENTPISRRDHKNSKKQKLLGLDRAKVKDEYRTKSILYKNAG